MNHFKVIIVLSSIFLFAACSYPEHDIEPATSAAVALKLTGTSWQVVEIDGNNVVDDSTITLLFPEDGKVVGTSGCNRYFGTVLIVGGSISFGDSGATMMACPEPLMTQERSFHDALGSIARGKVNAEAQLVLVDETGAKRIRAIEYEPVTPTLNKENPQPLDQASNESFGFDCGQVGSTDVRFVGPDTVELSFAGNTYTLPLERAASGAKYSKDGVTFWNKGEEAVIGIGESRYACIRT